MHTMTQKADSTPISGVDVHFNLHKRVWSCRSRKTGRVVSHAPVVIAPQGAKLVVREAGRQRVLVDKCKNVHAFARIDHGAISRDLSGWAALCDTLNNAFEVSYNPYQGGHFYRRDTGQPVYQVGALVMLVLPNGSPRCIGIL